MVATEGEYDPTQTDQPPLVDVFDGVVLANETDAAGLRYIRIAFGTGKGAAVDVPDGAYVIDAEFLFFPSEWQGGGGGRGGGNCFAKDAHMHME